MRSILTDAPFEHEGESPPIQTDSAQGSSGLPHSYPGTAEGSPDRLAELTPILEMADEARNVVQPPPDVSP
jgi:hypothetical protein